MATLPFFGHEHAGQMAEIMLIDQCHLQCNKQNPDMDIVLIMIALPAIPWPKAENTYRAQAQKCISSALSSLPAGRGQRCNERHAGTSVPCCPH